MSRYESKLMWQVVTAVVCLFGLRARGQQTRVVLAGNVAPAAQAAVAGGADLGVARAEMPVRRVQMVLRRSALQEAALEARLAAQTRAGDPAYGQWLTPSEFGAAFGPSDAEVAEVTGWLRARGFTEIWVNAGRTVVEFSGNAGKVEAAFGTSLHALRVGGETHYANLTDPSVPARLAPLVAGLVSLNNLPRHVAAEPAGRFRRDRTTGAATAEQVRPQFTLPSNNTVYYGITPFDFATIYDVLPLWNAATPVDGTGQTIAVVGDTDIDPTDFVAFRKLFSLPLGDTTVQTGTQYLNIIYNGPKPAVKPDEFQADSDTQWAAAVAKGAVIDYVASETTEVSSGDDLSAAYIVDNNLAPILSYSASTCELALGTGGNAFYKLLWQQAAAQGITVLLPSGDSGGAGCDATHVSPAASGSAVNGMGSTPYNISVGGTEFYLPNGPAAYFNPTNDATQASAKGYIPETVWNDTCTNPAILAAAPYTGLSAEQACNLAVAKSSGLTGLAGSGGGASACTTSDGKTVVSCGGGYAKPSWQAGLGVPADGLRDVPDVALFASQGRTNNFYVVCQRDRDTDGLPCSLNYPYSDFAAYGGTSVATPAFAGILALVAQKTGARLGNANPVLYGLAAQQVSAGTACNATGSTATGCVFHDVTTGTNAMPCVTGSPGCVTTTAGDAYGVLKAVGATAGYDMATGLGSVDAANLVNSWATVKSAADTAVLTVSPQNVVHGAAVTASVTVTGTGGVPTGLVSFSSQSSSGVGIGNGSVGTGTLTGGSFLGSFRNFPGGTYGVRAHYAGDATFAAADSNFVSLTVMPEASATTLRTLLFDPVSGSATNVSTAPYGSVFYVRVEVAGASGQGVATGNVALTDNGVILGSGVYRLNSSGYTEAQNNSLTPGSHLFAASYAGDASFNASAAPSAALTITLAPTTAAVTAAPAVVSQGATVTLSATIATQSFGYAAPSGVVTFRSGSVVLGTSTLKAGTDAATYYDNATATLTVSAGVLSVGNDPVTVSFPGDSNYLASVSPAAPLTVTPTTLLVTTTTAAVSPTTVAPAGALTFTATVGGGVNPVPTGTVQFAVDGQNLGNPVVLPAAGSVGVQTTAAGWTTGSHVLTAVYSGDGVYRSSMSVGSPFVVAAAGVTSVPAMTIVPTYAVQGTFIAVGVRVTGLMVSAGLPVATGTVQLVLDGGPYGAALPLASAAASLPLVTNTIQVGSHVVSVFYSGDTVYAPSYAAPTTITIAAPGSTVSAVRLSGLTGSVYVGSAATFSAIVSPVSPVPTGVFQVILDGGLPGSPVLLSGGQSALSVPTTGLALGTHTVQVFYSGDATYNYSTSALTSFTVLPAPVSTGTFTMTPVTAALTVNRLLPVPALTFTVSPVAGFNSTVSFSCANLPANTGCLFLPSSVNLSGSASAKTSLQFVLNTAAFVERREGDSLYGVAGGMALCGVLMVCVPRRRRLALLMFAGLGLAGISGCGGGFGKGASPAGVYTVQIIGTAGNVPVTQVSTVTLTIQ